MNVSAAIPDDRIDELRCYFYGKHTRYGLMFDIGVYTGLRISDILSIRVGQVRRSTFTVIEQKTGKKKVCKIPLALLRSIKRFVKQLSLDPSQFIVFSANNLRSEPLSRSQAYKIIAGAKTRFNMANLTPHSMRKTYATNLFKATGDINLVMRELNHSNIATTILYIYPVYL